MNFLKVFIICFFVGMISDFVVIFNAEKFKYNNIEIALFVIPCIGSSIVIGILWLIEHVRFV